MKCDLPIQGHQLGWVRVATRLASEGTSPQAEAIQAWLADHPVIEVPRLDKSALSAPGVMARELGFLSSSLGPTDLGHSLLWAERMSGVESQPFQHSVPVRWVLWAGTALAEPAWWQAALSSWRAGIGAFDWLVAAACRLQASGEEGRLNKVIQLADADQRVKGGLAVRYGQPWFKQIGALEWTSALPRLNQWAINTAQPWTILEVWEAFRLAENLPEVEPASLEEFQDLLGSLPETLRGLDGAEADPASVQLCGTLRGLVHPPARLWSGPTWERLLEEAKSVGVYRKAGATSSTPNLKWTAASLQVSTQTAAPPLAHGASVQSPVRIGPAPTGPADERARSWLRMIAWWARGRGPGDSLLLGHDSWRLVHFILKHWLRPGDRKRWEGRTKDINLAGEAKVRNRKVAWLSTTLTPFSCALERKCLKLLIERLAVPLDTLAEAIGRLPAEVAFSTDLEGQLTGTSKDWLELECKSLAWLASCTERGLWTTDELLALLQERAKEGVLHEALSLVGELSSGSERTWLVETRLAVSGELPDSKSDFWKDNLTLFLDSPAPFQLVTWQGEVRATSSTGAAQKAAELARSAVLLANPELAVLSPTQAISVIDEAGNPASSEVLITEAGLPPWFQKEDWLRRRPTDTRVNAWTAKERQGVERAARHEAALERLVGLWVVLEATCEDGADGLSVVHRVAPSGILAMLWSVRSELDELARLFGEEPPAVRTWVEWSAWSWEPPCEWVASRFNRLREALSDAGKLTSLCETAVSHTTWLLMALYGVRNLYAHEAWRPELADEVMIERFERAVCPLVGVLVATRKFAGTGDVKSADWTSLGSVLMAIDKEGKQPAALLDELGVPLTFTSLG